MGTITPILSRLEFDPQKNTLCQKPTRKHETQNPDLLVICREGIELNTGKKIQMFSMKNYPFLKGWMSPPLVFDSVKDKSTPLIGSNDHHLSIAPLFARDWFADAFSGLFGLRCFHSNSRWNILSHFPV